MAAGIRILMVKFQGDAKGLATASDQAAAKMEKGKAAFGKIGAAATLASVAVVGAVGLWAKSTFEALGNVERLRAQTESALDSMNVKWTDVDAIDAYAGQIEKVTGVEAELVTEGQNLLLTFGNIQNAAGKGNAIFDRSTSVMTDMSVALGQDMKSSATQLGKALNDPIKGVTALQRVGVSFTESQKKTIESLVESGDTLGAQKLILEELEKQFGGSAEAFGETMPGQIAKAKNAFGEMSESLLTSLMPTIQSLMDRFMQVTDWMMKNQDIVKKVGIAVVGLAAAILLINGVMMAWRAAVVVATAVQWLWNIAMSANPLGLIILVIVAVVAGLVLLYTRSETARKIMDAVFRAIVAVVKWWWENIVKRYIAAVVIAFKFIVEWAKKLWEGIKLYFGFWKGMLTKVINWVVGVWNNAKDNFNKIVKFAKDLPGRIGDAFAGLGEALSAPFRAGFQAAKDFYNNTLGGKGFDIPSWVPGVGGKSFRFPSFHQGGIVPGPAGREVPILARAGEVVLTPEQMQALGGDGGTFEGTLVLDSGEFLGVVRGQLRRGNRQTRRSTLAGAGAAR